MNTSTQPSEGAGGSRSRAAGELTLGLLSGEKQWVYADPLWERACSRRRPASRPVSSEFTRSNCGSWLACEGGLPADLSLPDVLGQIVGAGLPAKAACQPTCLYRMYSVKLWALACLRWRPANQPLTDVPDPIVGASLLAMTDLQSTLFIAQANNSDHSHKTFSLPVGSTISSL
ncbi:hypothetical protein EMIT0P291_10469 [Pseudomonas sp. IT-P291]